MKAQSHPRNPVVRALASGQTGAGRHGKARKASRRAEKIQLRREL